VTGPAHVRTCPAVDIHRATHHRDHKYGADADWGVLDGFTLASLGEYD